ncbi:MAG TPA: hypothetical protein VF188_10005 [Longimicrobiales bacterium]
MSYGPEPLVPLRFDLSRLVRRSVASLYSHLVTRPTGQALRLGIESQIGETGAVCLSVLDFGQVAVLDYSCADEAVAKLILRYQRDDRPADAYFLARGVGERHRETIEAVLARYGLALVIEENGGGATLIGEVSAIERAVWTALEELRQADAARIAERIAAAESDVASALDSLTRRRVLLRRERPRAFVALSGVAPAG